MTSKTKLGLKLKQQHQLSPQQILLMKLLQLPLSALSERIQEELEANPALEEGLPDYDGGEGTEEGTAEGSDLGEEDRLGDGDGTGDGGEEPGDGDGIGDRGDESGDGGDGPEGPEADDALYAGEWSEDQTDEYLDRSQDAPEADSRLTNQQSGGSFLDDLLEQWHWVADTEEEKQIGVHLIGNLDPDGYLRRPLANLADDLAFQENLQVEIPRLQEVLAKVQELDPPGVGARDLQECLLLQLRRRWANRSHWAVEEGHFEEEETGELGDALKDAILLLEHHFDSYGQRQFDRLAAKLGWDTERMRDARSEILSLNPRPGDSVAQADDSATAIPDFYVWLRDGRPEMVLNEGSDNKTLKISTYYREMLEEYHGKSKVTGAKEASDFIRSKIDQARWFMEALEQRRQTLRLTMEAILDLQQEFFLSGNKSRLKPMILKDVSERIGMDISTVSRVVNSKYVQTWFGHFPLKSFFSEGIATQSGTEVSAIQVREVMADLIEGEDKSQPLDDDALMQLLLERGFRLARRTVAKYREQLGIPVARLRRNF
ncbi:MAG: RNA polymerase factor sigma-54 [Bacteroidia bacterium]